MRIAYLSHANNYHTIKWATEMAKRGHEVHVLSLQKPSNDLVLHFSEISFIWLGSSTNIKGTELQKIGYFFTLSRLKQLLHDIEPDVIHAHYASSYGLLCSLVCKRPYYLSIWGSDIYDFPKRSWIHRLLIMHSVRTCSWLWSTSKAMAKEAHKYTSREIEITPFGVDMSLFKPNEHRERCKKTPSYVVGTIKGLEKKYGIDVLLKACQILIQRRPEIDLEVRIAGSGSEEKNLRELARQMGLNQVVSWLGFISQEQAAKEWGIFDVAVISSIEESESFGVSAVEAQACGTALVVSDIPGLMEACDDGKSALVVERNDPELLCDALEFLFDRPDVREEMAVYAREYVRGVFGLDKCFDKVETIYRKHLLDSHM